MSRSALRPPAYDPPKVNPADLRHYFAASEHDPNADRCNRHGCARARADAVHLTPGDDTAWTEAVRASTTGHPSRLTNPAIREPARKRHAARWTFGTGTTPNPARGPSASG